MHSHFRTSDESDRTRAPLRFPIGSGGPGRPLRLPTTRIPSPSSRHAGVEDIFGAIDDVSRRIDDLARELNCLGFFDEDDGRPRAA